MLAFIPSNFPLGKKHSPKWFNSECAAAVAKKDRMFRELKLNPSSQDIHNAYKQARNACAATVDAAKESHVRKVSNKLLQCPSGSRGFWSLSKAICNNFCTSRFPPILHSSGYTVASPSEKASVFAHHFAANSSLPISNLAPPIQSAPMYHMGRCYICPRKVRRVLQALDTNKATGPDGIPPIVLKKCAPELSPVLSRLFELSLVKGRCPLSWKSSHVIPVPKKGDLSLPSNYRPIAITSVLCKVLETLLTEAIMSFCEQHSVINDKQYGFRKQRSTADLLSYVTNVWSSSLDKFGESTAIALDISKAFDRVWHPALLAKLYSVGIHEEIITWVRDFLTGRSIAVRVDGFTSESHSFNAGVPQGCVLSPMLFLIFINDLLSQANIHSFADDSTLHASISYASQSACNQNLANDRLACNNALELSLQRIINWGAENRVVFNENKTQVLRLSLKRVVDESQLSMGDQHLNNGTSLSLLGLTISPDLSWTQHIRHTARRASSRLAVLWRARQYFSSHQLLVLYKAQVRPLMEYCTHVWPRSSVTNILDRVQDKAIRLINDVQLTSHLQTLAHRRDVSRLCLFYRYYFGQCSEELAAATPQPRMFVRNLRGCSSNNPYLVKIPRCRTEVYKQSFFPSTAALWNSLPSHVFPPTRNLQAFKLAVNKLKL